MLASFIRTLTAGRSLARIPHTGHVGRVSKWPCSPPNRNRSLIQRPTLARWLVVHAVCGMALALLPAANRLTAANLYSLQDLGPLTNLGGGDQSKPYGVNNHGHVAAANAIDGNHRALRYDGTWLNLETLGGNASLAAAINDSGQVVGYSKNNAGFDRGFVWTPGGTDGVPGNPQMKALGTFGGNASAAYAVNQTGQITGYAQTTNRERAFLYSQGTMTDIGTLLGASSNSFGYGINDAGHIAGTSYNVSYSRYSAFYYNGSSIRLIGTLGGSDASALAINNHDQITGYATTTAGFDHAFRYANNTLADLGTLGGDYSYGLAINNHNVIVGGAFIDPANTTYHAFITRDNTLVDLNSQLDSTGTGWTLIEARAISDTGHITGIGRRNGALHAFLLSPILPQTLITSIEPDLPTIHITFTTTPGASYTLERTSTLQAGPWPEILTGIQATGSSLTVSDTPDPTIPTLFYRVRIMSSP
jgi:probable HAF family extracellular repeat protein